MRSALSLGLATASLLAVQAASTSFAFQEDTSPSGEAVVNPVSPARQESDDVAQVVERVLVANGVAHDLQEAALKELAAMTSSPDVVVPFDRMSEGRRQSLEYLVLAWSHSIPEAALRSDLQDKVAMDRFRSDMRRVFLTPVYSSEHADEVKSQLELLRKVCEQTIETILSDAFPEGKDILLANVAPRLADIVVSRSANVDMSPQYKYPIAAEKVEELQHEIGRQFSAIAESPLLPDRLQQQYLTEEAGKRRELLKQLWTAVFTNLTPKVAEVGRLVNVAYYEVIPKDVQAKFAEASKASAIDVELQQEAFQEMTQLQKNFVEDYQRRQKAEFDARVALTDEAAQEPVIPAATNGSAGRILLVVAGAVLLVVVGIVLLRRTAA